MYISIGSTSRLSSCLEKKIVRMKTWQISIIIFVFSFFAAATNRQNELYKRSHGIYKTVLIWFSNARP